jgi:hypothetical protein
LNKVRANFTACCHYPAIVIWEWQFNACVKDCNAKGVEEEEDEAGRCCVLICGLNAVKILTSRTEISSLKAEGFIYSFMLSIGNESIWEPVITNAINRCFSEFASINDGYDCGLIPFNIYDVADCAYLENYLKCPSWNPSGLPECKYTYQYAKDCFGPIDMGQ